MRHLLSLQPLAVPSLGRRCAVGQAAQIHDLESKWARRDDDGTIIRDETGAGGNVIKCPTASSKTLNFDRNTVLDLRKSDVLRARQQLNADSNLTSSKSAWQHRLSAILQAHDAAQEDHDHDHDDTSNWTVIDLDTAPPARRTSFTDSNNPRADGDDDGNDENARNSKHAALLSNEPWTRSRTGDTAARPTTIEEEEPDANKSPPPPTTLNPRAPGGGPRPRSRGTEVRFNLN